jgi:hypothetical protein
MMKISTEGADSAEPITSPVRDKKGLAYESIDSLKNVVQLDALDKERALVVRNDEGKLNLETIALP